MSKHNMITYIRQNDGAVVGSDEAFNKDGILKSGFAMRTSLQMTDAMQKDVAANDKRKHKATTEYVPDGRVTNRFETTEDDPDEDEVTDAAPMLDAAKHRPGFRSVNHAADSIARAQQITRDAMLADTYAEVDAAEATRHLNGPGKQSDADNPRSTDATSVEDAYLEYDKISENAWRGGK
jgi:hypothetical protein